MSSRYLDNLEHFTRPNRPEAVAALFDEFGTPREAPAFYRGLSSRTHFDRITEPVLVLHGEVDGVLTVSAVGAFATNWLAPRIGGFQLRHPNLAVRLSMTQRLVDFAQEDVDVALRAGRGPWPGVVAHRLLPMRFTPACSPDLLRRYRLEGRRVVVSVGRLVPRKGFDTTLRAFPAILAACPGALEIGDRAAAIAAGLDGLQPGDVLVVAGKGHEQGQTVGDTVLPFDDVATVRRLL